MATTILIVNLGVIVFTKNQITLFGATSIFFEYSQVMILAGISSYLILIVQVFLVPNFALLLDFLVLFNPG